MSTGWMSAAACAGIDPSLFVGPYGERPNARLRRETQAKAVCAACPSRVSCLEFSLALPVTGVFGGLNDTERAEEAGHRSILPWCNNGLHRMEPGWDRCFACKADSDKRRAQARRVREGMAA